MTEAVQAETQKPGITVVTNENFDAYVTERVHAPVVAEPEETPESKAAAELEKVEKEKAERIAKEQPEEIDHPDKEKKGKLNERFSELTAKRKAAEEAAAQAKEEAKAAREAREAAEKLAHELKMKYEPPKSDEIGPKPVSTNYTNAEDFATDLEEWTANKVRIEDKKAAEDARQAKEQEALVKAWNERQEAFKAKNPEYEAKLAGSDVRVSDQVRDAIVESEVGPQILLHLADNPDVARKIGEMTVAKALREIGKLEAKLSDDKPAEAKSTIAEISKAPAPIDPIKNANSPVVRLSGSDDVPKNWTYEQWKKARQAGKIQ